MARIPPSFAPLALSLLAFFALGCPGQKGPSGPASSPVLATPSEGPLVWKLSKTGAGFRLSNADDEADLPRDRKTTPATPLSASDAKKMTARLPAIKEDPDDQKDFNLRAKSIPAPRPGKTVSESFPPPAGGPATPSAASGPLKVERRAPEGPVELAPHLTVTFTRPMVAVTSVDDLAKEHPPVRLTPEPPGKWRWLGTKTVMFQPEKRFPMATDYVVEVPAGTKSIDGQTMSAAEKWSFSTPAPIVKTRTPEHGSQPLEPLVYVEFDQAIEAKAMLDSIEMRGGKGLVQLRLADPDEVDANPTVHRLTAQAEKGRWLAFRPAQKLAVATNYVVRVKQGARGAEGPRRTEKDQDFSFSTYGALRVTHHSCSGWSRGKEVCAPLTPWSIAFTNAIDMKAFDPKLVSITPELPGAKVEVHGSGMTIRGKTKGRTKYTVTIAGAIGDVHEQTMGRDASVEFDVGSAEPTMFGAEREMIVLDPGQTAKEYPVYSINEPGLHARVYAVTPDDWKKYVAFAQEWERPHKINPPGRLVSDRTITPKKLPDELVTTGIDLTPALAGGLGQALVVVEPTHALPKGWIRPELHVWVQSTEIGLDAMIENEQITGFATRLADGRPLPGVDVQLLGAGAAKTDASGLARVGLTTTPGRLIVGRQGKDTVIVPERWFGEPSYTKRQAADELRWLVYDDRGMYKPGEEVHVKGWLRRAGMGIGGDLEQVPNVSGHKIDFKVRDPRWAEIGAGSATLDDHGGFDFAFKLPGNANLGRAQIEIESHLGFLGATAHHPFQVQEFRRPEFEVTARTTEEPKFVGKHAVATLTAAYYSGGGLADSPVEWHVTSEPTSFTPPNRSQFHFGPEPMSFWSWRDNQTRKTENWTAKTNPQGTHRLRVDFDAVEPSYPMALDITGNVTDVNRQSWSGRTHMLVHPSDVYVGVRLAKNFLRAGESIDAEAIVVDIEGKPVTARKAKLKAARIDQVQKGNQLEEKELEVQECEVEEPTGVTAANERQKCSFKTKDGGVWRVVAIVTDEHGRKNQTTTSLWVMGGERPKSRSLERAVANVVLDKKDYEPGDLAEVLVVAPFAPAEGILTVRRQGITHIERFTMTSTSHSLKVKLDEPLVPNAQVRVDLVGQDYRADAAGVPDPKLPKRPAFAAGAATAAILPTARTLDVTAVAKAPKIEPGGSTQIEVDVKDVKGQGIGNAAVSVVVVDESVLALSGYKTPDPIAIFYAPRSPGVQELGMRDHVMLAEPDLSKLRAVEGRQAETGGFGGPRGGVMYAQKPAATMAPGAPPPPPAPAPALRAEAKAEMADDGVAKKKERGDANVVSDTKTPMTVRSDFSALALFSPTVKTNARGHASVPVKLPDNLTRYRVMAVAASTTKHFGASESTLTAQLPVMARPSAPRFLNFGDRFELPVVVQNQTDKPIEVGVVARATNATVEEPSAKRVKIAANDRVEVRFAAGTVKPGTARFQFGVASGSFSDASEVELPVYTPATTEAFATYGEIDDGAVAQPVKMPPNVFAQFGGLEVTTSSTQLQALTDALLYLVKYPFECNEQLASRVVSIAALRDVLTAFKAKDMPSPEALAASMKTDFEKLKRRQHYSGGWGFWQEEPWPYLTIHVAHALVRAKEKGYTPDEQMLVRAQSYLRSIESHIPSWYGPEARRALIAYSIYVRNRMKDPDPGKAKRVIGEAGGVDKVGIEALGWMWPTISEDKASAAENEAIRRHVANRVTEAAGAAHFVSGYSDANWVLLNSDRRADAVLLEAMIGDQKDATLIPKLVKGLLGHKKAGRWYNTQENAFVLLALDRYFNTYEKITPDYVARVWLGEKFAGEHAFRGRTTEFSQIGVPMSFLAAETKGGPQNLVVAKDGPGRLYYRIGMQYAPTDLKLPAADYGFVVSRLYEGAEKPDDVKREADGTWKVKAGAKVRVRVSMMTPARRYHVALVDPIPAGLEPMNPALAVTGEIPKDPKANEATSKQSRYWYWSRTWYEHQNMRDERVEAFASLLWDGVWEYTYVARATTPGTFVVPPAKAEEMYSPETFGRSAGDRIVIE